VEVGVTINPLRTRERVVVPDRPKPTKAQKVSAWNRENGICWWCGKPVPFDGPDVQYDHKLPRELSADDSTDNLYPMHTKVCHERKTLDEDRPRITKAHHQERLTTPRQRSGRGFRGWRRFDGTIVRRDER
jgi:hypothetical protein